MHNWIDGQPLEPGITVLEASAGTGKTFRIAQIILRLLAEHNDIRMADIAVTTFTRAATGELVDRIRARLAEGARCMRPGQIGQQALKKTDPVLRGYVADLDEKEKAVRLRRIERAKREFDQALISTIHGFCQRVLTQNAFETGAAFGVELDSAIDGLLDDIISDFYSAYVNQLSDDNIETYEFWHDLKADDLKKMAKKAVGDFSLQLLPKPGMRTEQTGPELTNFLNYVERSMTAVTKPVIVAFDDLTRHFAERLSTPQGWMPWRIRWAADSR